MKIEILFFGQLTDIVGCTTLLLDNPGNILQLKEQLFLKFTLLKL